MRTGVGHLGQVVDGAQASGSASMPEQFGRSFPPFVRVGLFRRFGRLSRAAEPPEGNCATDAPDGNQGGNANIFVTPTDSSPYGPLWSTLEYDLSFDGQGLVIGGSPAACAPSAPDPATRGCSRPGSRQGRAGAPPRAAAPARRPTRSTRRRNRRSSLWIVRLEDRNGRKVSSVMAGVALSLPRRKCAGHRTSVRIQRLMPRSPLRPKAALHKEG